eukprot:CAMPEP_0185253778 /NCGR_PEP_ID=MMETSP1359-20130426/2380_1 /TAXON_ID=552665 /ORGANISM="Bigelowiella longifila, Strain CCMP242" /LENGTH=336 /DNA_ID=CAMNT_0027836199 /DNA_START=46 /DNA_END=1056 /DNA_ORIENTATION=-
MNSTLSNMSTEEQSFENKECKDFPRETIATAVGCILAQVCAANEKLLLTRIPPKSRFQATNRPQISIQGYVSRIAKYSQCNSQSFILALIYIDRLIQRNPSFLITSLNAHRLFVTAIVVAAKFSSDFFFKNSFYAKVGGISTPELNELELEFLFRIHFVLFVKEETFKQYHAHLMMYANNTSTKPGLQLRISPADERKTSKIDESVNRPQGRKWQHLGHARGQDKGGNFIDDRSYVSTNTVVTNDNRTQCPQLTHDQSHHYHKPMKSNQPNQHRRHHSDIHNQHPHFFNATPYAKRHRSHVRRSNPPTEHAFMNKRAVSMDIWFPMKSTTTTVAAR